MALDEFFADSLPFARYAALYLVVGGDLVAVQVQVVFDFDFRRLQGEAFVVIEQ